MEKEILIRWCEESFYQETDVLRAFDCTREWGHAGRCDSPFAQEMRREWAEKIWNAPGEASI
jgi:hypothetical protein